MVTTRNLIEGKSETCPASQTTKILLELELNLRASGGMVSLSFPPPARRRRRGRTEGERGLSSDKLKCQIHILCTWTTRRAIAARCSIGFIYIIILSGLGHLEEVQLLRLPRCELRRRMLRTLHVWSRSRRSSGTPLEKEDWHNCLIRCEASALI